MLADGIVRVQTLHNENNGAGLFVVEARQY
jgi:hypothetical protein